MRNATFAIVLFVLLFVINTAGQDTAFDRGLKQFDSKQYEQAILSFRQVLTVSPQNYAAYYNMGLSYYNLKRYDEAVNAFKSAINIKPDYTAAHTQLGNAYDYLSKYNEAIAEYVRATELEFPIGDLAGVVLHVHVETGVRVHPLHLGNRTLQFDRLGSVVLSRERVVREHRHCAQE